MPRHVNFTKWQRSNLLLSNQLYLKWIHCKQYIYILNSKKETIVESISQELVSFRNFYYLYFDAARLLMQIPGCEVTSFLLNKRGLQLASTLFYFIKNETMPNINFIPLNCTAHQWNYFLESPRFVSLVSIVLKDIVELRDVFEEQFTRTLNITNSINIDYERFINDDLNKDIKNIITEVCAFTAKRIKQDFEDGAGVEPRAALYLLLINSYEKNGAKIPFYKNVGQFIDGIWKKDTATVQNFLNNLVARL